MKKKNGGRILRPCFPEKDRESIDLHYAIEHLLFHRFFLLLSIHAQSGNEHDHQNGSAR
jgi:hypothetical protein